MLVRSLTLAALLAAVSPAFAADSSGPLAQELGKARPLVIIAPSSADPTLRAVTKAMEDPATQAAFKERNVVLYSVAQMMGKRDDKNLEQQTTMALIRELKLGASKGTKVILVGKDGERHMLKDDDTGRSSIPRPSSRRWTIYLPVKKRSRLPSRLRPQCRKRSRKPSRARPPSPPHRPSPWKTEPLVEPSHGRPGAMQGCQRSPHGSGRGLSCAASLGQGWVIVQRYPRGFRQRQPAH